MTDLCFLPATELAGLVHRRMVSPVELVDAYLDRIDRCDGAINAYAYVAADEARAAAKEAERALSRNEPVGPLHGLPVAIKIANAVAGMPLTLGSRFLADVVADRDDVCVTRLKRAGAIVIGMANMPEFGHSSVTENAVHGETRSPLAPHRNAGGSSGGSAAAVAAGMAALAQGSDGGGSIRIPAACCGVFGLKPHYGRVALDARPNGFLESPMTACGPLTRTTADAALMLQTLAGPESRDPFSLPSTGEDLLAATHRPVQGLRVAFDPTFGGAEIDPRVAEVVAEAVAALGEAGAQVDELALRWPVPVEQIAEAWTLHATVEHAMDELLLSEQLGCSIVDDRSEELFSERYRRSVLRGRTVSALEFQRANVVRTQMYDALEDMLRGYDAILTPTTATPAPEVNPDGPTAPPSEVNGKQVDPFLGWVLTYQMNLSGHPAASVPAGFLEDGTPIGLQIVGRRFDEATILTLAGAVEAVRPWADRYAAG